MKYIAIVDDELLANFRVDVEDLDMVLVVEDKTRSTRGIYLKPIVREMLVTKDGNSVYLQQKHIECLMEMERKEMFEEAIQNMMKSLGLKENHADN